MLCTGRETGVRYIQGAAIDADSIDAALVSAELWAKTVLQHEGKLT